MLGTFCSCMTYTMMDIGEVCRLNEQGYKDAYLNTYIFPIILTYTEFPREKYYSNMLS